jgi:hypothetical protein
LIACAAAGLTTYTILDSVTAIGEQAFNCCISIESIIIPESVTSIGAVAFWNCDSLKEVYCKSATPPAGGERMFNCVNYNKEEPIGCKIYVPYESVDAYKAAEVWKDYANYIVGYDFEKGEIVQPEQPGEGGGETPEVPASGVYTSDAAFVCSADNSTNKCYTLGDSKINGSACSGVKLGTSQSAGFFTSAAVGVEGTKTLSFYGMAWKGKSATIYIKVEGSDEVKSVAVKANNGATGNPPYTITVTDADYYSVELTGLTADSKIIFSTDATFTTATSSASRAVLAGITLK